MERLRKVFVLLVVVLMVPLLLLLKRALASVEVEREARHRAVADRLLDEMEGELSAWLQREEGRPYAHYRYFFLPDDLSAELRVYQQSPLADEPTESFAIGPFQFDPRGRFETPLWPRTEVRDSLLTAWEPSEELNSRVNQIREVVDGLWTSPEPATPEEVAPPILVTYSDYGELESQIAGTTVPLRASKKAKAIQQAPEGESSGLEKTLEVFNRGTFDRQQVPRQSITQSANVFDPTTYRGRSADLSGRETRRDEQTGADMDPSDGEPETLDVFLEPMVGRLASQGTLVVYRTVLIQQRPYRQGWVLDGEELLKWLGERVLGDSDLRSRVRILPAGAWTPPDLQAQVQESAYAYRRRFAEPFAGLAAVVLLDPLETGGGSRYLYTLAALLLITSTLGLGAVYRMVAVVVGFAERRSNFVAAVTHELKTPLTALRMYGEMLRDGVVLSEDRRQKYYEIMTAESERLTRLVNNVLELSRLEQKSRRLEMRAGHVAPLLDEVVAVLGPHAESLGFRFRVHTEEELPAVRFDRDALLQVLFNLVDNALKYSRGEGEQEIELTCRESGDGGVELVVADRGPGVRRRHLRKIFEPFYRGENELTRTAKGTGIGLALVRGLVEQMGGEVMGSNRPDGGFEVTVALPAKA